MTTKLVYVLTCAPEDTYIEQALMAVWSARYHNPDAHIVLITDDKTDELLEGSRGEILKYISEKIVIPFDADKNMHYRSRCLKTSVRGLVKGDYLFIDCDTITMCDLSAIEQIDAEIAMVRDENISIADEKYEAAKPMIEHCAAIGLDITKEKYYFNSGVMYVRDTKLAYEIYEKWHKYWLEGIANGINVDQPTFAKANISIGRPVVLLEDKWNTIVPSQIKEVYEGAMILHFWHSVSFLYTERVLYYIREKGMTDFIKYYVLHPTETFLPTDNHVYEYKCSDYRRYYKTLKRTLKTYADNIDSSYTGIRLHAHGANFIKWSAAHRLYGIASLLIIIGTKYRVKWSRKYVHYENFYACK